MIINGVHGDLDDLFNFMKSLFPGNAWKLH